LDDAFCQSSQAAIAPKFDQCLRSDFLTCATKPLKSMDFADAVIVEELMTDTSNYADYIWIAAVLCVAVVVGVGGILRHFERRAHAARLNQQRTAALSRFRYNDGTDRKTRT
jgi:hypothetical protein